MEATDNQSIINESQIKNANYFKEIDEMIVCRICLNIVFDPTKCALCDIIFCKDCIGSWQKSNNSCPNCRGKIQTKGLSRNEMNIANKVIIVCPLYGCEVNLLDYPSHLKKCSIINKEVECWVCSTKVKIGNLKISEDQLLKYKQWIEKYNFVEVESVEKELVKYKEKIRCLEEEVVLLSKEKSSSMKTIKDLKAQLENMNCGEKKEQLENINSVEKKAQLENINCGEKKAQLPFFNFSLPEVSKLNVVKDYLFPLFGIKIGISTKDEIMVLFPFAKNDGEKNYNYLSINGVNFWLNKSNIFSSMYFAKGIYEIPLEWKKVGLDYSISYNSCKIFLEKMCGNVLVKKAPNQVFQSFKKQDCFSASLAATNDAGPKKYFIEIGFDYEQGDQDSTNTLYNISIKTD